MGLLYDPMAGRSGRQNALGAERVDAVFNGLRRDLKGRRRAEAAEGPLGPETGVFAQRFCNTTGAANLT